MTAPNQPPHQAQRLAGPPVAHASFAPPPVAPAQSAAARPRRFTKLFGIGMAGFLLSVVLIVYALSRGQEIKRISPTGDVEFYSSGGGTEFSSEEIQQRQEGMEQRLSELEQQARETGGSREPAPDVLDLSGIWFGANGAVSYQIDQFGTEAVIQEISAFGVTATGSGEVDDTGATFDYVAIDGSTGVADLELTSDGRLVGEFFNNAFGTSVPAELTR